MKTVLFLCTGNYYRSRFAEELFNFLAPARCPGWRAQSRGVAVDQGGGNVGPIATATAAALAARGVAVDIKTARMPQQLAAADLDAADYIVALKQAEHLPLMRARFSAWPGVDEPGRIEWWHVHDVDLTPPEKGLPQIAAELEALMLRLSRQKPVSGRRASGAFEASSAKR